MYELDRTKFGHFVAERRKEKGYTQKQLAQRLFISDKAISKWETGVSIPDAALWIPLAEALGVTVTELLMCRRMDEDTPLSSGEVESLVKGALHVSEDSPERSRPKRQHILVFLGCVALSAIENLLIWRYGAPSSSLWLMAGLGLLFGAYFQLFVKEKLPAYYDENKISAYSDGVFRMNVPGITFNNSNWPHIVRVGRLWTMALLVMYPLIHAALALLFPASSLQIALHLPLGLALGGLFVPLYIVGKKYQS